MADETRTVLIDIEINEGDANKSITTLDNSINDLTKSKDESAESTKNLSKESKGLTDNTKKSKTATDSMTKSVTEYAKKLGPAVLAVGALVAIGKGLIESLKTNKALMDALSIESAALSGVMDKLKADVGNATIEFLGLEEAIDEVGKETTFTEKVLGGLTSFFAGAGFTGVATYTGGLIAVADAAAEVERINIKLRDGLTAFNLEVGQLNLQYEEQVALTRELDQTTEQQLVTLGEATKTFEEIARVTQERIDLEVQLARETLAAADGSTIQKEAEDALNEALLKQATTMRGLSARRRELLNRQKEATNRLIAEEKAHQTFIGTLEKENAEIDKLVEKTGLLADVTVESEEKKTAALEKSLDASLAASDKRIAKSEEELNRIIENDEQEVESTRKTIAAIATITSGLSELIKSNEDKRIDEARKNAETLLKNEELSASQRARIENDLISDIESIHRKNAGIKKAIAAGETIVNTASAIVSVLDDLPVPFNFIAAGIVGTIGATQLAIIQGQEFASGGMLKGQPHSKGGININAEGGEAIINKRSMANPILKQIASDINVAGGGKRFQFGGIVGNTVPNVTTSLAGISSDFERAISKRQTVLVLEDLNVTQDRVAVTEDRASLSPS